MAAEDAPAVQQDGQAGVVLETAVGAALDVDVTPGGVHDRAVTWHRAIFDEARLFHGDLEVLIGEVGYVAAVTEQDPVGEEVHRQAARGQGRTATWVTRIRGPTNRAEAFSLCSRLEAPAFTLNW
ncbi:hypothetical protein ACWEPC_57430 [Nonomuraea sp. NPDC004297]